MSMYTKQILELIVLRPGIRTVEIADAVDCDIEMVQPSIQDQITAGQIAVKDVTAPNGRAAKAFIPSPSLVEQYRPSPEVKTPVETPATQEAQGKNKVQAAEIYLAKHGTATVEKMREVLQCGKVHPNAYLATAIGKGRVVWEGGIYRIGTVQERRAARDQQVVARQPAVPDAPSEPIAMPPGAVETPEPPMQIETPPARPAEQPAKSEPKDAGFIKIQMIEEPTFTIQFGPVKLPGMRLASEWNGMKELRDAQDRALIVLSDDGPFTRLFSGLWGKQPTDIVVIKGHRDLIDLLESAAQPELKAA